MDFNLTEEQVLIQQSIQEIAKDIEGFSVNEALKSLADMDFLGMFFPEEVGGAGGDFISYVLALKELAKVSGSLAVAYSVHSTQAGYSLYKFGNSEQKEKFLVPLCKGEKIGSFAYQEAWIDRDMLLIETTAEKEGDYYILNGSKTFVLNGDEADLYILLAKTDEGITAFVVEKETSGLTISKPYKKMGLDDVQAVTLSLENVKVPSANVLGGVGSGEKVYETVKVVHNISLAAIGNGLAATALEKSISYGKEREQFNRPIVKFEAIQEKIGKMTTNLEAANLLTLQAAALLDSDEDVKKQSAIARYFSLKTGEETCNEAIQIHGGYGYSKDLGVEVLLRDIKGIAVLEVQAKPLVINIANLEIN